MALTSGVVALYGVVIVIASILVATTFAALIPLDSVQAVTGISIIIGVAYGIAFLLWAIVMVYYSRSTDPMALTWINTHMIFLVLLPGIIGATAMNVVTVQNTRNLVAGKITSG
jgi:hypothetical protein